MPHALYTEEQLFIGGDAFFNALLGDINEAKQSITLETYIFDNDIIGKKIADTLIAAATRGVDIRILVDGVGTPSWSSTFQKQFKNASIQTKVFHPLPWKLTLWRFLHKVPFLLRGLYLALKANSRNHRKTVIIDDKIAYLGSMNIRKCHLSSASGGSNWHDIGIRLFNVDLSELQKAFEIAWSHRTIQERIRDVFQHMRREPRIRLNYTRHRRRVLHKSLLRRMRLCQRRIWVMNAYFVPNHFLFTRLTEAAKNGVDVRILLPHKSNISIVAWASSAFYFDLLKSGIKIYEYLPSMLHAKALILDDWMLIGSSNLNHRSLLHDLEADITLFNPTTKQALEDVFLHDFSTSRKITLEEWSDAQRWYQRLLGKFALYVKYWI